MQTKHCLFVSAANRNRRRAAERLCKTLSQSKNGNFHCESAGVDPLVERRVTKAVADRADTIVVMEDCMKKIPEEEFQKPPEKIICLDTSDLYPGTRNRRPSSTGNSRPASNRRQTDWCFSLFFVKTVESLAQDLYNRTNFGYREPGYCLSA